ncbi:hypothetical protein K4K48_011645 [Colletotrichum sp. SAR 10_66]|nr:hypothetical protein K4K48_011645 [Colletotrichum sp. SAR 10_66]
MFPRRTLAKTGYEAQSASFVQWWCSASMTHGEIVNSIDDAATRMVSSAKSRAELLVILLKANMGAEGASIPVVVESLEDAQNALRDGRRKALVQYLTQHPAMRSLGIVDEGGLFEHFLIDVEMGSGLETTRIKQAISTTNPTLRDSKTELFRSVGEEKVMQSSLSDETARAVIRSYIKGPDEIGNLRIESFHWEMPPASPDDTPERRLLREKMAEGIFHFIARPRSCSAGFSCSCPSWPSELRRPWIDPASFAATITTTTEKQSTTLNVGKSDAKTFLDKKMGWSELVDDVWFSPNESQTTLTVGDGTNISREMLSVIVFRIGSKSGRTSANTCLGDFTLQGPTLSFRDYATMVAVSPFGSGEKLASIEFGMVTASSSDAVSQKTMAGYASDPAGTNPGALSVDFVRADAWVPKGLWPAPWFTLPEAYTTAPSQDAMAREAEEAAHAGSTMPLFNILGEDFREVLSADTGAGGVFAVMDGATIEEGLPQLSSGNSSTRTQVGFGAAFGKFSGLAHCQEVAVLHSIYNWEAGFNVVALLVERFISLQQCDLALQPLAYMKRFVFKYIQALAAAGDVFFRQNSLEMLPMTIQRYTEASHIFGPAPQRVPDVKSRKQQFKSYNKVASSIDDFCHASVQLRIAGPYYVLMSHIGNNNSSSSNGGDGSGNQLNFGLFPRTQYFGFQANPEFGKLRSLIDDRLFKVRHSVDINGNVRRLSLWDPPLDVGALVSAATGAGSFGDLLQQSNSMSLLVSGLGQVLPRQRFTYLLHKTFELCEKLRRTAGSLLSTMEKKDGEALQLLRSEQDTRLQRIMTEMKVSQKTEAERGL